ncbi:ABC transporter ATP-binding protein [Psychrobacillus soli]|uniref:ABC transporter ATP-binding protein n=1 Tax=Psychrobacillus soli TaxID=1543965 RepID=A0A544TL23_9BACI|nr:ABC transporter ATP-binding protein [Psychrobacillus soli]TQR18161.1 ABC transporter ATP-binding protein [Psychrobacillus soli]
MSINDIAVKVESISKCYYMYQKPEDRLKQMFLSRFPIEKSFVKEFWALRDVSFEIKKGETLGIIGRNGSGKSTLLQLIANTLSPTSGSVRVNGRVSALLELGSGFNPEFTGRENVYLSGSIYGISKSEMDMKIGEILDFADIGEFIDQPVKTFSSGMFARLAFSVAINVDPDILIVDEILAVGDSAFQAKCNRAFHKLSDEGCTVLLVTQDPYMVRNFCSKALYLKKGNVISYGNPTAVTDKYLREIEQAQSRDMAVEDGLISKEQAQEMDLNSDLVEGPIFRIEDVKILDANYQPVDKFYTGDDIILQFKYLNLAKSTKEKVVFVFSLYRHDDFYICGNTTLMDGLSPFTPKNEGIVEVRFPNIRLLSGNYKFRVAVDDERGIGIFTEAFTKPFEVEDNFEAVGLINLERNWEVKG